MRAGSVDSGSEIVRVRVLGVPVDCLTMASAKAVVRTAVESDNRIRVLAVNPEKIMTAKRNSRVRQSIEEAELLIPDGIGVVWAARTLERRRIDRVAGADLMPEICSLAEQCGFSVFLFGAAPGVAEQAAGEIGNRFPSLSILGTQHGYMAETEMQSFLRELHRLQPDIIFVALGSPKQELWIDAAMKVLPTKVYQGVGGTFDVLAGRVKRAPAIFIRLHLEWLFRLLADPRRIKRQVVIPQFVISVILERCRRRLTISSRGSEQKNLGK